MRNPSLELFRSSCWPDAVDDHGAFIGSAYDLIDWANSFDDEAYRSHQHYLSNMHIDLAGDADRTAGANE
jgi:hypothetical protein